MALGAILGFQSHAGSIEAYSRQDPAMDGRFLFNPTLVRLRRAHEA